MQTINCEKLNYYTFQLSCFTVLHIIGNFKFQPTHEALNSYYQINIFDILYNTPNLNVYYLNKNIIYTGS